MKANLRGLPNHDQRPPPNAVMFDLDDTLVDHSSALRTGALALAEAAQITGDRTVRVSSLDELPALLCRGWNR